MRCRVVCHRERKEMIEARNEADTLAYSVEKSLTEYKVGGAGDSLSHTVCTIVYCTVPHRTVPWECSCHLQSQPFRHNP